MTLEEEAMTFMATSASLAFVTDVLDKEDPSNIPFSQATFARHCEEYRQEVLAEGMRILLARLFPEWLEIGQQANEEKR